MGDTAVQHSGALPAVGDLFASKYRIERCIGRGGMGAVFRARHEMLDQSVAIKVLLPEIAADKGAVARFLNEARASAKIRSDHVAKVVDVDTLPNGSAYMVLELLEGSDLATVISSQGPVPVAQAASYLLQALDAVAQAHVLGIVHRDLKPANLFLANRPDGTSTIKVLDFGISKRNASVSGLTATDTLLGSPSFMSPEQVRSPRTVDTRSDIWSIGVCLYQLLTGALPFKGENVGEVFAAILEQDPTPVSQLDGSVSPEIDSVVSGCLQRERDSRFQDVTEVAEALSRFAPDEGLITTERIRRIFAGAASAPGCDPPILPFGSVTPRPAPRFESSNRKMRRSQGGAPSPSPGSASSAPRTRVSASAKYVAVSEFAEPSAGPRSSQANLVPKIAVAAGILALAMGGYFVVRYATAEKRAQRPEEIAPTHDAVAPKPLPPQVVAEPTPPSPLPKDDPVGAQPPSNEPKQFGKKLDVAVPPVRRPSGRTPDKADDILLNSRQ